MTKDELMKKASLLGLSTSGTKAELEERVSQFGTDLDITKKAFDSEEAELDSKEELDEKAVKPLTMKTQDDIDKEKPRPAIRVGSTGDLVTRIAKVSTVKFCGRWHRLIKGKPFTADSSTVEKLARAGVFERE